MTFVPLTPAEVDAKSPIDDSLMGKIKDDLNDLDARVIVAGAAPFVWEITGQLKYIRNFKRSVGFGLVNKEFSPSICRILLKKSGTSALEIDIRKHTRPNTPITEIAHQYSDNTSSIAQFGSAINTQSVNVITPAVNTQSIVLGTPALNVTSIIKVHGSDQWRYNLSAAPSAFWAVGDVAIGASCTSGGNNGSFVISEVNQDGGFNIVVTNASGVAQVGAAGTLSLQCFAYTFVNPVSSDFVVGESAVFSGHTALNNDGTFMLVAVNSGGNNVIIKNQNGATQVGAAGTTTVGRWVFAYASPVSTTFVVGDRAKMSGHTSGSNDGSFPIVAVNFGGNNLIVHNPNGIVQGSAGGTALTNIWKYSMPSDPTAQVSAADHVYASGHSNALNNGLFLVRSVTSTEINIYNPAGVAQGGAAGALTTTRKLVKFAADAASSYTVGSYIEMRNVVSRYYEAANLLAPFPVVQINRGGGANYNVVIETALISPAAPAQPSNAGRVVVEMQSIFNNKPSLAASMVSLSANENAETYSTDLTGTTIPAQTPVMLYLTSVPTGDAQDLTVLLS